MELFSPPLLRLPSGPEVTGHAMGSWARLLASSNDVLFQHCFFRFNTRSRLFLCKSLASSLAEHRRFYPLRWLNGSSALPVQRILAVPQRNSSKCHPPFKAAILPGPAHLTGRAPHPAFLPPPTPICFFIRRPPIGVTHVQPGHPSPPAVPPRGEAIPPRTLPRGGACRAARSRSGQTPSRRQRPPQPRPRLAAAPRARVAAAGPGARQRRRGAATHPRRHGGPARWLSLRGRSYGWRSESGRGLPGSGARSPSPARPSAARSVFPPSGNPASGRHFVPPSDVRNQTDTGPAVAPTRMRRPPHGRSSGDGGAGRAAAPLPAVGKRNTWPPWPNGRSLLGSSRGRPAGRFLRVVGVSRRSFEFAVTWRRHVLSTAGVCGRSCRCRSEERFHSPRLAQLRWVTSRCTQVRFGTAAVVCPALWLADL